MARQCGIIKITGTIGGITFYKMGGEYYLREKSSLSRRQVKKDPAFRRTMEYANLLGRSSKFAAKLKQGLNREERRKIEHGKLTGQVQRLLKEGKTEQEILAIMRPDLAPAIATPVIQQPKKPEPQSSRVCTGQLVAIAGKEVKIAFAEQAIRQALANDTGITENRKKKVAWNSG